jgi:hypothetical protein
MYIHIENNVQNWKWFIYNMYKASCQSRLSTAIFPLQSVSLYIVQNVRIEIAALQDLLAWFKPSRLHPTPKRPCIGMCLVASSSDDSPTPGKLEEPM